MRILLTNHEMAFRGGSELATTELALRYSQAGHSVSIFSLFSGTFGAEFEGESGIRVHSLASGPGESLPNPDLILAFHWPTLVTLDSLGVRAPVVLGFLGVLPPVESPPPLNVGTTVTWWGVSREVVEAVERIPGWATSPHRLIPNWYDDCDDSGPISARTLALRRILVVSNHFPAPALQAVKTAATELGIEVHHVGLPENPQVVSSALLDRYDAVVTLGRTAVQASARGIPVLVADSHGADGWVTAKELPAIEASNFSGRAFRLPADEEAFRLWLSAPPSQDDLREVREKVVAARSLSTAVSNLTDLAESATVFSSEVAFGRWAGIIPGYLDRDEHHRKQRDISEARLVHQRCMVSELRSEVAGVRNEMADLQMSHVALEDAYGAAQRDLLQLQDSASWRLTRPLRAMKAILRGSSSGGASRG